MIEMVRLPESNFANKSPALTVTRYTYIYTHAHTHVHTVVSYVYIAYSAN